MFFVGYDGETGGTADVVFTIDNEAGTMTTDQIIVVSAYADQVSYYEYYDDVVLSHDKAELPDLVELPEDAEVNTWYLSASDSYDSPVQGEVGVAIVGNDIYVQGLCSYLPEAWVKGTVDGQTATFASGQFYGTYYDTYNLFFFGADVEDDELVPMENVVFAYDAENGILSTDAFIVLGANQAMSKYYDYYYDLQISRDRSDTFPVEVPENLETETYLFKALAAEAGYDDDDNLVLGEPEDYQIQVEVGFDGDDLYIQGISTDNPEFTVKATKNEAGQYVIPACQYIGREEFLGYIFDYYFTAVNAEGEFEDAVLTYDAQTNTFTSTQTLVLNGSAIDFEPYLAYDNVTISKIAEVAATPADPCVESVKAIGTNYPSGSFVIPAEAVDGNPILTSKMSYVIYVEKDSEVQALTLSADLYDYLESDMTEIPYTYDDSWDIYAGGSKVYLNQEMEEIQSWTKIGVQSFYYGAGQKNASQIGWYDLAEYWEATGIADIAANGKKVVFYNLQGQKLDAAPVKGLYIMNGKKYIAK
jgi:hypothetical protein